MRQKLVFWAGLIALISYWIFIKPAGLQRGYIEDHCHIEMSRQMMADQLREYGAPRFETKHYMAPDGTSSAYMPQAIEQTWLGAVFWNWNRDFPFLWAYFGVSLLFTYLGVGLILGKMGLPMATQWGLATAVTLFHIPRHFVLWYHNEHVYLHWIYLGFFLDAWIWQRFFKERKWSWTLDLWRGVFLLGVFGTCGYFWGPSLVEWVVLRICLVSIFFKRKQNGISTKIEGQKKGSAIALAFIAFFVTIDLQWFLPLLAEVKKLGIVSQGLGYHAPVLMVIRPLWFDWVFQGIEKIVPAFKEYWWSFQAPETKVTIGWFYWIPAILGMRALLKKKKESGGLGLLLPFLILLGIAIWYLGIKPHIVQIILQTLIPFMIFFRVSSRWGLFLPPIVGAIVALSWPDLRSWYQQRLKSKPRKWKILTALFLISSAAEFSWMSESPIMMPPLSDSMHRFLSQIRDLPGKTVLDMPFCVFGGNEVCKTQCVAFPYSMAGVCLRQWHDKDVYGIYQSRLVESQCQNYFKAPYHSWFNAWAGQRCFTDLEWTDLCNYLDEHTELAALLIYPDLWTGAGTPECMQKFAEHLGPPLDQSAFFTEGRRGAKEENLTRILRYASKCKSRR